MLSRDPGGKLRWHASVNEIRGSELRLADAGGNIGWSAGVNKRGSELKLSDTHGQVRWSISVDDDGAHIRTYDAAGKELPIPNSGGLPSSSQAGRIRPFEP